VSNALHRHCAWPLYRRRATPDTKGGLERHEGGDGTMARLPDIEGEQSKLTTVLRALSNAKRIRILNELSDGRERSVSELEGVIASLSQSALSQHLARLRRANIVKTRRESQTIYYSIDDPDVLRILRLLGHIYNDDPVMKRTRH
ncbi:MAG: metalloregulator ArsR/SmtB family transcription factor, partial [Pseudomonadota bacterium]|nr:metalloregulator ArsR/SmtB family transcription factor [Pseudomonadota bacterium]